MKIRILTGLSLLLLLSVLAFVPPAVAEEGWADAGFMSMPDWLYYRLHDTIVSSVIGGPYEREDIPGYDTFISDGYSSLAGEAFRDAIRSYDKAIGLDPDSFEAWLGKGMAYEGLKRYQSAIDAYDTAITIRPDGEDTWIAYGGKARSYLAMNRYDTAASLFEEAIRLYEASGDRDDEVYAGLVEGLEEATQRYENLGE